MYYSRSTPFDGLRINQWSTKASRCDSAQTCSKTNNNTKQSCCHDLKPSCGKTVRNGWVCIKLIWSCFQLIWSSYQCFLTCSSEIGCLQFFQANHTSCSNRLVTTPTDKSYSWRRKSYLCSNAVVTGPRERTLYRNGRDVNKQKFLCTSFYFVLLMKRVPFLSWFDKID